MREGCHIFFPTPGISLLEAAALFDRKNWRVQRDDDEFTLQWEAGPTLRVLRQNNEIVLSDAKRLGAKTVYADFLNSCDCRFVILFHDLDAALDEINTLIETQMTIQDATNGLVYCTWNDSYSHLEIREPIRSKRGTGSAPIPTPAEAKVAYPDGIPCPECGCQLRTAKAKQCLHCGADWH